MEGVWGFQSESYDPTVTTHLSRLRRKLEPDANSPTFLLTVRGVGYRFIDANEADKKFAASEPESTLAPDDSDDKLVT